MPKELSESDMADHVVRFHAPDSAPMTVRAAYVTADAFSGMLVFKDHKHRTLLLVNQAAVLSVERDASGKPAASFQSTSQVMEQTEIKPGDII